jgi:hypothetical protein
MKNGISMLSNVSFSAPGPLTQFRGKLDSDAKRAL